MQQLTKIFTNDNLKQFISKRKKFLNITNDQGLNVIQLSIVSNAKQCFIYLISNHLEIIKKQSFYYKDLQFTHETSIFIFAVAEGNMYFITNLKQYYNHSDITVFQVSLKLYGNELFNYLWQDEDFIIKDLLQTNNIIELLVEYDLEELYATIIKLCDQHKQLYRQVYIQLSSFGRKFDESKKISKTLFVKINDILEKAILKEFEFSDEIVTIWENKVTETQFGTLSLKIAEKAAISQYEMLNLITGNDNEVDERFNEMNKKIRYLNHRINLRKIIQASFIRAQKLGIQNKQNLDIWFQCQNEQFTLANLQVFKRNICRDEGIYNGLTLAQICIIEDNLGILNIIIYEEYHLNLKMTIAIQTKFGVTTIPVGSNLLQLAVILNSKNCLNYLMSKGAEFNYIDQKSSEGESTFGLSMRTKDKTSNVVIDDEKFLENEMKNNEINGENILIKSLQYNNIHMLLKWQQLIHRVDFALDIMQKVMLKNKDYHAMIDVCQSEEAVKVTKQLTNQSLAFIVDNFLFNDQHWRKILNDFFGDAVDDFIQLQNKILRDKNIILQNYEKSKYSLLADFTSIKQLQQIEADQKNLQTFQRNQIQFISQIELNAQYFETNFYLVQTDNEVLLSSLFQYTKDNVLIFNDMLFLGSLTMANDMILEKNQQIPAKPDSRATNYQRQIFNGFYIVHYLLLQDKNKNMKYILDQQLLFKTKSKIVIKCRGISENHFMVLPDNSTCLQMLLLCGKFSLFKIYFNQAFDTIISKKLIEFSTIDQNFLSLIIEENQNNNTIVEYLIIVKQQDFFKDIFNKIIKINHRFGQVKFINVQNWLECAIFANNITFLTYFNIIFDQYQQDTSELVEVSFSILKTLQQESIQDFIRNKNDIQILVVQLIYQSYGILYLNNFEVDKEQQDQLIEDIIEQACKQTYEPVYLAVFQSQLEIVDTINPQTDFSFLDNIIQNVKLSKLFDAIVDGCNDYVIKNYSNVLQNSKEQRQTNFETIFKGLNPLAYAILFNNIELVNFFMQFDHLFDNTQQFCIYVNQKYLVFVGSITYLALAIIAHADNIFDLILNSLYQVNLQQQKQLVLTRLAAFCNFNHLFKQNIIMKSEFIFIQDFIEAYHGIANPLLLLGINVNFEGLKLIFEFIDKFDYQSVYIEQLFYTFVQRIDGISLIDIISQFNEQNKVLLQNLCQQSLIYLFGQSDEMLIQSILLEYYFYDDELFQEKKLLYKQYLNSTIDLRQTVSNDNIVPQSMFCHVVKSQKKKGNNQWVTTIKYYQIKDIVSNILSYQIQFDNRETNLIFKIHKGFAPIHYAALFGQEEALKYFLKDQGEVYTQQDTYIQGVNNIIFIPKNSSTLHIALIIANTEIINILLSYYSFVWFGIAINSQKIKEEDSIQELKKQTMPIFDFSIVKAAAIGDQYITYQIIIQEFQNFIQLKRVDEIKNILSISCQNGNLFFLKRIHNIVENIGKRLAYQCLIYRKPSYYIENLSLIQIVQRLSITQNVNVNFIWEMEHFISNQIGRLNFQFTKSKEIQYFQLDKYYFIPQPFIIYAFNHEFNVFNNPKMFINNDFSQIIVNDQQYICKDEQLYHAIQEKNIMKFQLNFSNQTQQNTLWLEACKKNQLDYILQNFQASIACIDYRPTNFKLSIFYGFSGIHYAILNGNHKILISLLKHEYKQITLVDQVLSFNKQIYFVPKNSTFLYLVCILRQTKMLQDVGDHFGQLCLYKQCNVFSHSIFDIFAITGMFNLNIARRMQIDLQKLNFYFVNCIRAGNLGFAQYLAELDQIKGYFQNFLIEEIAKDQFPPLEIQNEVHKYFQSIYNQIEIYAMRNLDKYKEKYLQLYGKETFEQMYVQFMHQTNEKLMSDQQDVQFIVQPIQLEQIEQNQNEQEKSQWFQVCYCGDVNKIRQLYQIRTYDYRMSNYVFNQYKGFTGLHYAIMNHSFDAAVYLVQYEQNFLTQYDNIVLVEGQYFLIKKFTKLVHFIIIFKFQQLFDYLINKKVVTQNLNTLLINIATIVDFYPGNKLELFLKNSDYIFITKIIENGQLQNGIAQYLESTDINQTSLKLTNQILQSCPDTNFLFIKSLEFCIFHQKNPLIVTMLKKLNKPNIKQTYQKLIKTQFQSEICDYFEIYKNNFLFNSFELATETPKNAFFDAVITNNTAYIKSMINQSKNTFDTRKTSNSTISGFSALFYAVFYQNTDLIYLLFPYEQFFVLPFDTVLPNKFFISKGANVTQVAAITRNSYVLTCKRLNTNLDFRGLNYVYFLAKNHIFQELIQYGVEKISGRKMAKWVQETRDRVLGSVFLERFTTEKIKGLFLQEGQRQEEDEVGRCVRFCFGGDVSGLYKGQFSTEKEVMLWLMGGGGM